MSFHNSLDLLSEFNHSRRPEQVDCQRETTCFMETPILRLGAVSLKIGLSRLHALQETGCGSRDLAEYGTEEVVCRDALF